jgi:NADH-quinone oxidoreductase subunit L
MPELIPESIQGFSLWAVWAAPLAPFIAFLLIMIFFRQYKAFSAAISITAVSLSLLCAIFLMGKYWHSQTPILHEFTWMVSGNLNIPLGLMVDPLSRLMLVIVTLIAFLVQIYSLGYMSGDSGFSRYFGFMSLFAWAMISLVLSSTLLQLYIFWELVGVSSYLLIGFWFEKFSASKAGKKAFVMTRAGDFAFFLGLMLLLIWGGAISIIDINYQVAANISPAVLTLSGLLILGGIVGKSAQFPLMTWLPDAMEGPTPVSALLHSATMVAAGVYLFSRLFPFFSQSSIVMLTTLSIGTISMLMAATMAMVTSDIKQVWAYSTISQLGYMLMGLGAGGYFAGIFHLTTHAVFKALLFLTAGVLIHACHTNDMFQIGQKGGRRMRITIGCMIIAGAALIGIWPFSGFFSKEAILSNLLNLNSPLWLVAGVGGVFLTAYYTSRLIFIILFPKNNSSDATNDKPHEKRHKESLTMAIPLVVLAVVTLCLGFFQYTLQSMLLGPDTHGTSHGSAWPLIFTSQGVALAAIIAAWVEYGRKNATQIGFVEKIPWLFRLFSNRWYLDHFYRWVVTHIVDQGISKLCKQSDDHVIDGAIHTLGKGIISGGRIVSVWNNTLLQTKLLAIFVVFFALALLTWITG